MPQSLAVFVLSLVFSVLLRRRFSRDWAIETLSSWTALAWVSRIRYGVAARSQELISRVTRFPVCFYCGWVEFPDNPHSCQTEVDEAWRQYVDEDWRQYEEEEAVRAEEEFENEVCPCGHKHCDHYADFGECNYGCPEFGAPLGTWEPQSAKIVWYTEAPCGHHGYE